MVIFRFLFGLLVLFNIVSPANSQSYEDVYRLEQTIFQNYSTNIKPNNNQALPIDVTATWQLFNILSLNEVEQTLSITAALRLNWTDQRIRWNPSDYGGMTDYFPERMSIWRPRIMLINTAGEQDIFKDSYFPLFMGSEGGVVWVPGGIFDISCKFNMYSFPFDTQSCELTMVAMQGSRNSLTFSIPQRSVAFGLYLENAGWSVMDSDLYVNFRTFDSGETSTELRFMLKIERRPAFFVLNVFLPVNLVAILDIFIFMIPIESGERIGVSLTVLLSQTVYTSIISTYLPTASDTIPLVVYFLTILTLMAVLTVVMCILLAWLHQMEEEEENDTNLKVKASTAFFGNRKIHVVPEKSTIETETNDVSSGMQSNPFPPEYQEESFQPTELKARPPASTSLSKFRERASMIARQSSRSGDATKVKSPNTLIDPRAKSIFSDLGPGKYKVIVTFLEKVSLVVFLSVYTLTLFTFLVLWFA